MDPGVDETLERGSLPMVGAEGRRLLREASEPTLSRDDRLGFDLGATRGSQEPRRSPAPGAEVGSGEQVPADGSHIGRYIILSRLGEGGMGVVLAAYDPELDRKVAIKLLKTPGEASPQARLRLQREAQALAKLNHRNVVSVHDVGVHMGQLFVAMEFVDGETLHAWMEGSETPRPWPEVLEVLLAAGEGLAAAHAEGLIHRDFKPEYRQPPPEHPQRADRPQSHENGCSGAGLMSPRVTSWSLA